MSKLVMTQTKRRRRLPDQVAEAMTAILDYLWQAEAQDYLSHTSHEQEGHIFLAMLTVRQWLAGTKPKAENERS